MSGQSRVIVGNDAGEEYSVTMAGFRSIYAKRGFRVLRHEDGRPYEPKAKDPERPSLQEARAMAKAKGVSAGGSIDAILARVADADEVPDTPAPVEEADGT